MMEFVCGHIGRSEADFWAMTPTGFDAMFEGWCAARGIEGGRAKRRRLRETRAAMAAVPDRRPSLHVVAPAEV